MSIWNKLFTSGATELVGTAGKAIDDIVTSKEEKMALEKEIKGQVYDFTLKMTEASQKLESEITARAIADSKSDSWLARNVRPLSFGISYLLVIYLILFAPEYSEALGLLKEILIVQISFYFGSRGIEKGLKIMKGVGTLDTTLSAPYKKGKGFFSRLFGRKNNNDS